MTEGNDPIHRREADFSIVMRRAVGPALMAGGLLFTVINLAMLFTEGTVVVEGEATDDLFFAVVSVVLPAAIAILGYLITRARPEYLDD
jgi:hypothetical protein